MTIDKNSKIVRFKEVAEESKWWYGVSGNIMMSFENGFADPKLFLDVVNGRYVTTTRDGVTVEYGNGMSGTSTLFFNCEKATDSENNTKVISILENAGYICLRG